MIKLYLFGNGNLSFENFTEHYLPIINNALSKEMSFIICDFRGADTLLQEYLKDKSKNVTILHCFEKPRYLADKYKTKVSHWELKAGFISDEQRDEYAIKLCSHFFAIDFNSKGDKISSTKKNIDKLKELGKIMFQ